MDPFLCSAFICLAFFCRLQAKIQTYTLADVQIDGQEGRQTSRQTDGHRNRKPTGYLAICPGDNPITRDCNDILKKFQLQNKRCLFEVWMFSHR